MLCIFVNMSNNNTDNENITTKEDLVAPSENPEDRPDLHDYKSKEESSNKVFSNMEELTTHYTKEHPESF